MTLFSVNASHPDLTKPTAQVVSVQLVIATTLGLSAVLAFSVLRRKWSKLYAARLTRRKGLPAIPASLFGWLPMIFRISEEDVLEHAGLDVFVFLGFFKMAIKTLLVCCFFAFTIISPVRYHFTGNIDQGRDEEGLKKKEDPVSYQPYLWMYVIFTYVFTFLTMFFLMRQTKHVVRVRQAYLGQQNSITDRTIRISGIPPELRDEESLLRHIESLHIGKVQSVTICREWGPLNRLIKQRNQIIRILEAYWAEYLGSTPKSLSLPYTDSLWLSNTETDPAGDFNPRFFDDASDTGEDDSDDASPLEASTDLISSRGSNTSRPRLRRGWFGPTVDAINHYTNQLAVLDAEIRRARERHYPATPTAFATMDSVATAQMMAQAVLDPNLHRLITRLAPAPHDIIWDSVCLSRRERLWKLYYITLMIGILSLALLFPVSSLATLLNVKTISKFWPGLGAWLQRHKWAEDFVTGLLPTYIFAFLNFAIPFLYVFLSSKQGYVSHGEEELSAVSKNFFYIFVNLFLVFTISGTASNYWGFISDTSKLAYQLAESLQGLSLFYVDLIILQGVGMFPFKLLLLGSVIQLPFFKARSKTPRDYRKLYRPPVFNFGLHLPQPMLIFVITTIYSVMSTKILACGLVYFVIGYYVYKYQLLYACVHRPHSTGKVWPIVFRRVVTGLLIFQLTMVGTLALSRGYILASCLAPLPLITMSFMWGFQKNYLPLSIFIALRAIANPNEGFQDVEGAPGVAPKSAQTLDERREVNQNYDYPFLVSPLDGPWIAIENENVVVMVNGDDIVRKPVKFYEWE
ncbi:hypothetical protein BABINDRAFT_61278 [Babjeviella inositovora NRRL Y-12698]|uniref:CSC1/OSCA1-like 7TM region domain-containing protein n=1 Tax=Babjeviella inositovora NRRL Y-12698 TaxID=984486 RepID=A0A1E3QR50_9ASCO|nr:uncharacterized protein BABINDRAFT_61278 [Babjeviella inositovora NRRL Y-12698]ODQ80169.1 hypothetical protein BABINDRAFT_61278 [Babjeviella inositovora NRRL Y-12698]